MQEVPSSVYFSYEDSQLLEIYEHIGKATTSDQAGTAVEGTVCEVFMVCFEFDILNMMIVIMMMMVMIEVIMMVTD